LELVSFNDHFLRNPCDHFHTCTAGEVFKRREA
jgi:hypothetical protein